MSSSSSSSNRLLYFGLGVAALAGVIVYSGVTNPKHLPVTVHTLTTDYFVNKKGLRLFTRQWVVDNPKGIVFLFHGLGEHCGRYEPVAAVLNKARYSVYAMDHVGHGRSEGDRAYVEDIEDYPDDVWHYIDSVLASNEGKLRALPRFIIGHSMGGLIVALSVQRRPEFFHGVVYSAPALIPDPTVATPFLVAAASFLSNWLPKLALDKLDATAVSRDPLVVASYVSDPLVYQGGLRARWGAGMLNAMSKLNAAFADIKYPFLVMQGDKDRLVVPHGATLLYEKASSKDKAIRMYPGLYHEIFHEPEKERVYADMITWLDERCK